MKDGIIVFFAVFVLGTVLSVVLQRWIIPFVSKMVE
jgi:antibiotic biosynthesis monooxygenase (ABM) superfamily enzyme